VAIADDGRDGEVRYLGEIDNSPDAVRKLDSARWRLFADALNILGEHMGRPTRRSPLAHAGARALLHQMGQVDVEATIARLLISS
jgi:hypothetical protein